jgi:hypothetical protein
MMQLATFGKLLQLAPLVDQIRLDLGSLAGVRLDCGDDGSTVAITLPVDEEIDDDLVAWMRAHGVCRLGERIDPLRRWRCTDYEGDFGGVRVLVQERRTFVLGAVGS